MKESLLGVVAVGALIGTPALAADIRMPLKAPPAPVPVATWTGCYIGGNVGVGWTEQTQNRIDQITTAAGGVTLAPADYGSETDNSLVGGAQVGCDYQLGPSFVIGAQGQFDWGDLNGSHVLPAFPTFTMNDKTDRFATATARLGYAFAGSALAYVKGGAAWVHNTDTLIGAGPPPFLSESASWTATGWTVGGGVEYRFMSNLSIFAEYDYMDFGTQTIAFAAPTGLFPFGEHINVRQTVQEAKLGVNWRFNFGGPFATRY